jgi:RHS repeat-associated protein
MLLFSLHLLIILCFLLQPLAPLTGYAAASAQEQPLAEEEQLPGIPVELPFEPEPEPLQPDEPLIGHENPEELIDTAEIVPVDPEAIHVEEPVSSQPEAPSELPPEFDVPVDFMLEQDRFVMALGETTYLTVTIIARTGVPSAEVAFNITLPPDLLGATSVASTQWTVPVLEEMEIFTHTLALQIAAPELPATGAVASFTVEATANGYRPLAMTHWLGLLPTAPAVPPTTPPTGTVPITDVIVITDTTGLTESVEGMVASALAVSLQSEQGAVLARQSDTGTTQLILMAAPGAVPAGTQFVYTDLTYKDAVGTLPGETPETVGHPLYLPNLAAGTATRPNSANGNIPATQQDALPVNTETSAGIPVAEMLAATAAVGVDDGVYFYRRWHLDATGSDGAQVEEFAQPVLLLLPVADLVAAGVDMSNVQLWTRPDATYSWQEVAAEYDEKHQVWVTRLYHFSDFTLGTGLSSGFDQLPSMQGFSSGGYTGAASFDYPLETPDGLGGLNPKLSLSYSSATVDNITMNVGANEFDVQGSVVGYGWNIGGLSYIARVELQDKSEYYTMVIDGQRVDIVGGKTAPRTNPELFAALKYEETSTTSKWTVTLPSGIRYTFGGVRANSTNTEADVSIVWARGAINDTAEQKFDRWFLSEVRDTSGNILTYKYTVERQTVSDCHGQSGWYTSAVYPNRVIWSDNVNDSIPRRMEMSFIYVADRTDTNLKSDHFCNQRKFTNKRLDRVEVKVFDASNVPHVIRSYELEQVYAPVAVSGVPGVPSGKPRHLLVDKVIQKGQAGGALHTYTFGYKNFPFSESPTGTVNSIRLNYVKTGYGAVVKYIYSKSTVNECVSNAIWSNYCDDELYPVTTVNVFDGVSRWVRTDYSYPSLSKFFVHGGTYGGVSEWTGFKFSHETTYAPSGTENSAVGPERHQRFEYYRDYDGPDNVNDGKPDPRKGRVRVHEIYNTNGGTLFEKRVYTWSYLVPGTPPTWSTGTYWPLINNVHWVRQDSVNRWVTGAGTRTVYGYDPALQDNKQFGNVTHVTEYSHDLPGTADDVPDLDDSPVSASSLGNVSLATWESRVAAATLTKQSVTSTWYYPEGADANNFYVTNRPARVQVANGSSSCHAETRYFYDNAGTDYRTAPTLGRLTRTQQALTACSSTASIATTDTHWRVTSYANNLYGNPTTVTIAGTVNDVLITTYDTVYNLFPTKQEKGQNTAFAETAKYYGVDAGIGWTDSRFAFGKLSEHCAVNGVCSFQTYDEHGRPTQRWERVASGITTHSDATATVRWSYRMPSSTIESYGMTEWRAPRCYGNMTRRHYNALGQLIVEQRSDPDWQYAVDGCGTSNLGQEIHVNYAYNALGQVSHQSVPRLMPRSAYNTYEVDWATVDETTMTYDALGRITEVIQPNGERTVTGYNGRITGVEAKGRNGDINRHLAWTMLDGLGRPRLLRTHAKSGSAWVAQAQIVMTHDVQGNVTHVALPGDLGTNTYTYNRVGQKLTLSDKDLGNWSYAYDRQGNLLRQTDGRGKVSCFYYDPLARVGGEYFQGGGNCPAANLFGDVLMYHNVYLYDGSHSSTNRSRGQLTKVEGHDPENASNFIYRQELTYEERGFLNTDKMTIGVGGSSTTSFTTKTYYDKYLRFQAVIYPDSTVADHVNPGWTGTNRSIAKTYYNGMGLPSLLCDATWNVAADEYLCTGTKIVDGVDYDAAGRITQMLFPQRTNLKRTMTYHPWVSTNGNSNGRLAGIKVEQDSTVRLDLTYTYDSFGNITQLKDGAYTENITYDYRNRVTEAYSLNTNWYGSGRPQTLEGQTFTYPVGGSAHPMAPERVAGNGVDLTFTYDANGNMISRQFMDGSNIERSQTLTWSSANRLAKVVGAGMNGAALTEEYWYTTQGQRVRKLSNSVNTLYPNRYYTWENGTLHRHLFFGDMRIGARVGSSGTVIPTYIQGDQVASSVATTSSSNVSKSRRHYAYGRSRSGAVDTAYGYTSQLQDSATGLYYYNARYYDSRIGYFISPDSIVPDPSNLLDYNRYAYARGNPLKYNDPTGHWIESAVDIGFIGYDLYDIRQNGLNWENGLSLAADVGGLILPIFTGGGLIVRGINHADDAADALRAVSNAGDVVKNSFDVVRVGDTLVDTTSLLVEHFDVAAQYGINSYDALRKTVPAGQGLEVHHIIEQRFAPNIGVGETGNMLSVVLTKAEHNVFKDAWRNAIGRSNMNSLLRTNNATPDDIWNAAQEIYAGHPELLEAARITLGVAP